MKNKVYVTVVESGPGPEDGRCVKVTVNKVYESPVMKVYVKILKPEITTKEKIKEGTK